MPEGATLQWSAYEHEFVERETNWFWSLGVAAVCIALTSILFQNFLFAVLILVAAATIAMLANVPPEIVEFEVSDRGIRVGRELHRYEEIIAFWVEDEHEHAPLLLVDTTKIMAPNLIIPIDGVSPQDVRAFLKNHAAEVPMREPIAHKLLEFFGF